MSYKEGASEHVKPWANQRARENDKTRLTRPSLLFAFLQIDLRSIYAYAGELFENAAQLSEQARTACAELVSYAQTRFAYV